MTRGKIVFLGADNKVYTTVEFNGDMYPEGRGDQIVQAFKDGHMRNESSFYNYVAMFDRRNFNYAEHEEELIKIAITEENRVFDVKNNWTDYLYIINESGTDYVLLTNEGKVVLSINELAIVSFQKIKKIQNGMKSQLVGNTAFLISKKEFSSILDRMKETNELINDIDERLKKIKHSQIHEFCTGAGIVITNEEYVLRLLTLLTEDEFGYIDYFVYDLKYGKEYQDGCITREDGSFVDLSSAEALYDFLEELQAKSMERFRQKSILF